MTTFRGLVLHLAPRHAGEVRGSPGELAHAAFYACLEAVDPALSAALHDAQRRADFTLSPLYGVAAGRGVALAVTPATRAWLRVTTLTDAVYDVFSRYLLLSHRPAFRLGEVVCDITQVDGVAASHPWAGYATLDDLARLAPSADRWTLDFASPTAIRWGEADSGARRVELFPQPRMALAGLRQRWDALTGEIWGRAFEEWVERNVVVGRIWSWATQPFAFQRQTYLGGQGKLEYRVLDAGAGVQVAHLHRLLHLAFYTGVGYKTTHGLGQVRLVGP